MAHAAPSSAPSSTERAIRRLLLAIFLLGTAGVTSDLLLLDHIESWTQLIPLWVIAVAVLAMIVHAALRRSATVRVIQCSMLALVVSGGLGAYLHYQGNVEFQIEIDPDAGGSTLFWKVMRAKAPPALAPLAMVQLGLIGFAWSFRHPLTRSVRTSPEPMPR